MRQQRQLAPRHHRARAAEQDLEHQSGADAPGVVRVVRLGAVADDRRGQRHHLARDVAVVVQAQHDRQVRAQHRAAGLELRALHIVDANGCTGAVQLQRQRVDGPGGLQAEADLLLEEAVGFRSDAPARDGPATHDGNDLDVAARLRDRIQKAADLAHATELLGDRGALDDAERRVVAQGGGNRIEIVGFLADVDQRYSHFFHDIHCPPGAPVSRVSCDETSEPAVMAHCHAGAPRPAQLR